MAVAAGFEPSAWPRSERRNGYDPRNNIGCNSLGFRSFVPKCAQNVPTARTRPVRPQLPSPVPDLIHARHGQPGRSGEFLAGMPSSNPSRIRRRSSASPASSASPRRSRKLGRDRHAPAKSARVHVSRKVRR